MSEPKLPIKLNNSNKPKHQLQNMLCFSLPCHTLFFFSQEININGRRISYIHGNFVSANRSLTEWVSIHWIDLFLWPCVVSHIHFIQMVNVFTTNIAPLAKIGQEDSRCKINTRHRIREVEYLLVLVEWPKNHRYQAVILPYAGLYSQKDRCVVLLCHPIHSQRVVPICNILEQNKAFQKKKWFCYYI